MTHRNRLFSPLLSCLSLLSLLSLTLFVACGDDEPGGCILSSDCATGQVCTGGQCVDGNNDDACRDNDDCRSGEICNAGSCEADRDVTDDDTGTPDTGTPDTVTPDATEDAPEEVFADAPTVVSSVPAADAATDVALDADISVTFDQPMRSTSIPPNIFIEDWRGNRLTRTVTYDESSRTVTLALAEGGDRQPFEPSSPYLLRVKREVRAENSLNMAQDFVLEFTTVGYDLTDYQAIAEAYAPVVYAEVRPADGRNRNNRIDWFTKVDFDGDLDAANNWTNARSGDLLPAHAYWNVLETTTHYFVQYVFYYPLGAEESGTVYSTAVEHDFAYSLVVVRKSETEELGYFVLAEGLGNGQIWGWNLDSYPNPDSECGGDGQDVCHGAIIDGDGPPITETMSADTLVDDRRYALYMSDILHASCLVSSDGSGRTRIPSNYCGHNVPSGDDDTPFANTSWSRILTPGVAGNWTDVEDGVEPDTEISYGLSSFLDLFWTQRSNPAFYGGDYDYNTPENTGEVVPLPSRLADDGEHGGSVSDSGRAAPFRVDLDIDTSCDDCTTKGMWFVDPAFALEAHFSFDHDFEHTYCFNPFRGIDTRGEEGCE